MNLLIKPGVRAAGIIAKTDSKLIDGFIHVTAISFIVFSHVIAFADKYLIDGFVNLLVGVSAFIGKITKSFQQGRIQGYFGVTIFSLILLILLLFFIRR